MASFLVCGACKVRIGSDYVTKDARIEPFGESLVCVPCFNTLSRKNTSTYQSLLKEGTIRASNEVGTTVPARLSA